jgi:heme-degrading monooxygenase HmoA
VWAGLAWGAREEEEMYARMATVYSQPDRLEEVVRNVLEQTVPVVRAQKGFRGFYLLVDRATGKGHGLSLWETEEDERASRSAVAGPRDQAAQQGGATQPPTLEFFEVVVQA